MDRPFGAEIELTRLSREHAVRILRLLNFDIRDESYNHTTRTWWKIVPDASIEGGFEVVSPILRGQEGVEALKTVVMALDDAGGRVDQRCGLHVHLNSRDLQLDELRSVINRYAQYEEQIDAFMPPSRRGNANRFCRSLRTVVRDERFSQAGDIPQFISVQPDRYYKVNLKPHLAQGSIEFRQHSGTLNALKIHNWLGFLDGFVRESCRLARSSLLEVPQSLDLSLLTPKLAALARMLMGNPEGINSSLLQQQLGGSGSQPEGQHDVPAAQRP